MKTLAKKPATAPFTGGRYVNPDPIARKRRAGLTAEFGYVVDYLDDDQLYVENCLILAPRFLGWVSTS
jgi:hypothetical protein